uniref:Uncharacterized protein n=1 Tax=Picea sitchensis TaxID=3332 RepID=C0PSM5_PICSI|nr:unknown [Picea sitchensis]
MLYALLQQLPQHRRPLLQSCRRGRCLLAPPVRGSQKRSSAYDKRGYIICCCSCNNWFWRHNNFSHFGSISRFFIVKSLKILITSFYSSIEHHFCPLFLITNQIACGRVIFLACCSGESDWLCRGYIDSYCGVLCD